MDRVEFGVERKAIVSHVNGVDLRDVLAEVDEAYAFARTEGGLFGIPADGGFPRGALYGHPGYAMSPFEPQVLLVSAVYGNVTLEMGARIAVGRSTVEWSDFDNFRAAGYPWHTFELGPYRFERAQYDDAVAAVARQFGPPPKPDRAALDRLERLRIQRWELAREIVRLTGG